jgi:hypothetical protein
MTYPGHKEQQTKRDVDAGGRGQGQPIGARSRSNGLSPDDVDNAPKGAAKGGGEQAPRLHAVRNDVASEEGGRGENDDDARGSLFGELNT